MTLEDNTKRPLTADASLYNGQPSDRIDYYLVNGKYVVILEELPLLKRDDYIEI